MEVIRRLAIGLLLANLTGCAAQPLKSDVDTMEKSSQCTQLRAGFQSAGLDIEMFRDASKDDVNETMARVSSEHVYPASPPSALLQEIDTLKYYAGKICGYKNRSSSKENHEGTKYYGVEGMVNILERFAGFHDAWLTAKKTFSAIDISRPFLDTSTYTYPSQKGQWREAAENRRKEYFQKAILNKLLWVGQLAGSNTQILELLDGKTIHPLSRDERIQLEEQFDALLKEYDIDLRKRNDVDAALDEIKIQVGNSTGDLSQYTFRSTSDHAKDEDYYGSEAPTSGNLLNEKASRVKFLAALLTMSSKVSAKRLNQGEVEITTSIDFPTFFRMYPLKDISDLVEK